MKIPPADHHVDLADRGECRQPLQCHGRIGIEVADAAADEAGDAEVGVLRLQVRLDAAQGVDQRVVGVDHPAVGFGDAHRRADAVQGDLDPRHLVRDAARLGHLEAQPRLHHLQALQELAWLVVPGDVDQVAVISLSNIVERANRLLERPVDRAQQSQGRQAADDQRQDEAEAHRQPRPFVAQLRFAALPQGALAQIGEQRVCLARGFFV